MQHNNRRFKMSNKTRIDIRSFELIGPTLDLFKHLHKCYTEIELWRLMIDDTADPFLSEYFKITSEQFFDAVTAAFNEKCVDALELSDKNRARRAA